MTSKTRFYQVPELSFQDLFGFKVFSGLGHKWKIIDFQGPVAILQILLNAIVRLFGTKISVSVTTEIKQAEYPR